MKSRPDHPRSRGVYPPPPTDFAAVYGSSPLARGLLLVPFHSHDSIGIIPARAGFTRGLASRGLVQWDHPRSRGVYGHGPILLDQKAGSSPLARGLRVFVLVGTLCVGIIPARAGFTPECRLCATHDEDHPRSRGVYFVGAARCRPGRGSSPLARGLRRHHDAYGRPGGIIPARAGFTVGDW